MEQMLTVLISKDNPAFANVLLITVVCLSVWVVLLRSIWRGEDESPIQYHVDLPEELKAGFAGHGESGIASEIRSGRIYPRCPADGRFLTKEPIIPATPQDIDAAIERATAAQRTWATTTFAQRRKFLATLLNHILQHQDEIVAACALDSGKTKIDACFGEILVSVEKLQWTIKHGEKALRPSTRPTNLLMAYKENTVVYEPLGVVAACFSWNYPFHFVASNVTSALFSGNAIVLKPSEQTCWSSRYFLDIARSALKACGHDPELIQNVICLPDGAEYLTSHPGLSHITFIGSKDVAYKVCASAAKALTPVCVELGGKDPSVILDDDKTLKSIDDIVAILMRGTFQSAGQNCIGIERVIALPKAHNLILNRVLPLIKNLRLGSILLDASPPDMGSMISPASFKRLESLISSAVSEGAILHTGGARYHHPKYPHGHYFTPTLLSNVTPSMAISQTELFAPVFLLMRADSPEHAVSIANSTNYALGASIFGDPFSPATQKCVTHIRAGNISVNDFGAFYACSMPFGGARGSGYGRFGGAEGLQSLCNLKSVCVDRAVAERCGVRTRIPKVLQYPVDGARGWEACKGVVETGYSLSWTAMGKGVYKLLSALMGGGGRTSRDQRLRKDE